MQLFALLAGLALATALWSGVQAVNSEARASYDAAATTLGEGQYDLLERRDGMAIAQEQSTRNWCDHLMSPLRRCLQILAWRSDCWGATGSLIG